MFQSLDSGGVPALYPYLTEDVVFRFGSFPAGRGRETFAETWSAMSGQIVSMVHALLDVWEGDGSTVCRGTVRYELTDGRSITVPFANVFYLRDGKIAEYLIYVDASPVLGPTGGE